MFETGELKKFYGEDSYRPPGRLLQWRANIYLKQILKQITINPDYNILEIGCNHGYLAESLLKFTSSITGIDINPSIINNANKNYLQVMDACDLKFPDTSFDLIISTHTVEHIPNTTLFFKEMVRVLKKDGHIVLIYPWEPIRGYTILPEVLLMKRSLRECRKIHVHAFTPLKIKSVLSSSLVQKKWKMFFVPQPNFISVIKKID